MCHRKIKKLAMITDYINSVPVSLSLTHTCNLFGPTWYPLMWERVTMLHLAPRSTHDALNFADTITDRASILRLIHYRASINSCIFLIIRTAVFLAKAKVNTCWWFNSSAVIWGQVTSVGNIENVTHWNYCFSLCSVAKTKRRAPNFWS